MHNDTQRAYNGSTSQGLQTWANPFLKAAPQIRHERLLYLLDLLCEVNLLSCTVGGDLFQTYQPAGPKHPSRNVCAGTALLARRAKAGQVKIHPSRSLTWAQSSEVGASTIRRGALCIVRLSYSACSSSRSCCTSGRRYASVLPLPVDTINAAKPCQPTHVESHLITMCTDERYLMKSSLTSCRCMYIQPAQSR